MTKINWRKVGNAIEQRDAGALRTLAEETNHKGDRRLILLLADLVGSDLPGGGGKKSEDFPRIMATLRYDSWRQPLPAGARADRGAGRQVLYQAGPYSVDLRLEPEPGGGRVCLVGQIADRREPERSLGDVPVLLMSGKTVVGRAFSNVFGEFHLAYRPERDLLLCFPVEHRVSLRLDALIDNRFGSDRLKEPRFDGRRLCA